MAKFELDLRESGIDPEWLKAKTTEQLQGLVEEYQRDLDIKSSLLTNDILNSEPAKELMQ